MTIGIISAIPEAIAALNAAMKVETVQKIGLREYTRGNLFGKEVVTVFSRWGKVAASTTSSILVERFGVEELLFTGLAGAVSREISIGDIVIGDNTVQYDVDVSALTGTRHEIPLLGISQFPLDPQAAENALLSTEQYLTLLPEELKKSLKEDFSIEDQNVFKGTIASGDKFIASTEDIDEIRAGIPGALCVEMEGAAIAQIGHEYAIQATVIRVISDKGDCEATADFSKFSECVATPLISGIIKAYFEKRVV